MHVVKLHESYCQELAHSSVLGVIEGSDNLEERLRSAKETAIRPVDGIRLS